MNQTLNHSNPSKEIASLDQEPPLKKPSKIRIFLNYVKNSIISKIFGSNRYEVRCAFDPEVKLISYKTSKDHEDAPRYMTPSSSLDNIKSASESSISIKKKTFWEFLAHDTDQPTINNEKLQFLGVINQTFNRQLDIFEELIQYNHSNHEEIAEVNVKVSNDQEIKGFIQNMIMGLIDSTNTPAGYSIPEKDLVSCAGRSEFGDQLILPANIKCECQHPDSTFTTTVTVHENATDEGL